MATISTLRLEIHITDENYKQKIVNQVNFGKLSYTANMPSQCQHFLQVQDLHKHEAKQPKTIGDEQNLFQESHSSKTHVFSQILNTY